LYENNLPATVSSSGDTDIYRAAVDTIVAESPTEPGADMAIILCGYKVPSLSFSPCLTFLSHLFKPVAVC